MTSIRNVKIILTWTAFALLLAGLQTVMWPLLTGGVAAPQLWLNLILFFILFRPVQEALLISYALALLWSPFTSLPIGVFWVLLLVLVPAAHAVKSHIFWPSARYFAVASFLLTSSWHLANFAGAHILEGKWTDLHFVLRLTEVILTPMAALPQYALMHWLDGLFAEETLPRFHGAEE